MKEAKTKSRYKVILKSKITSNILEYEGLNTKTAIDTAEAGQKCGYEVSIIKED